MSTYITNKQLARDKAIDWQRTASQQNYSYAQLAYYEHVFEKLAKRYGLIKEFKENGII